MSHVADSAQSSQTSATASSASASDTPVPLPSVTRLVSMDTVSRNPNLGLIETVRDELRAAGIESPRITHDQTRPMGQPLRDRCPRTTAKPTAAWCLSGHTDVVPVDGQQWDSDPFKPEIRGDLLYGRGTCDMKGFIGAALALVPEMQGTKLARPIHFALSFDEEVGCAGAPLLISRPA